MQEREVNSGEWCGWRSVVKREGCGGGGNGA